MTVKGGPHEILIFPKSRHWKQPSTIASRDYSYEDHRNLITDVENTFGSTTVSEYTYAHNEIGQRTHQPSLGIFDTVFFE
ncbi:MAG: hypothetical protein LAT58_14125 [Opitutales bacterium]|nr:hypothetical protein [Opitutales bacterium]